MRREKKKKKDGEQAFVRGPRSSDTADYSINPILVYVCIFFFFWLYFFSL